jgi:hypothetical protein
MKHVQATVATSALKREHPKHEMSSTFLYFFGHFCPPESGSNPDPKRWLLVTVVVKHRYRNVAAVGRVPYPLVIRVKNLFILFLFSATLSLRGSV